MKKLDQKTIDRLKELSKLEASTFEGWSRTHSAESVKHMATIASSLPDGLSPNQIAFSNHIAQESFRKGIEIPTPKDKDDLLDFATLQQKVLNFLFEKGGGPVGRGPIVTELKRMGHESDNNCDSTLEALLENKLISFNPLQKPREYYLTFEGLDEVHKFRSRETT